MHYFSCAIEVLERSRLEPVSIQNPNSKQELLYRFFGKTTNGESFIIQVKERRSTGEKSLMSIFPEK